MADFYTISSLQSFLQKQNATRGDALTVPVEESLTMSLSCSGITVGHSFSWLIA